MELDDLLFKLDGVREQPSGFSARCPAHDDQVASLSINNGRDGGLVLHCHAGCAAESIVAAMGITMGDLMGAPHVSATYDYTTEQGRVLYTVERWVNPKTFRCVPGLPPPAGRILYRAVDLAEARRLEGTVFVVEGEKDANRLASLGLTATCNVGGAGVGKWLPHYADYVKGCHVIIVADNDEPGFAHARDIAGQIMLSAASVRTVHPRYGKDVSELLDLGWTLEALDPLPENDALASVCASNVTTRPVRWAWPGYIALGKVTIIEGDPGDGKSILSTDLVARWTSGAAMPDDTSHDGPYSAVMVTAEDDLEDTIVPRLRTAGANLARVRLIDHGSQPNRPFTISTDMAALYRVVLDSGAKILTLDPLMAFVGDTDSHNDASVRQALYPLYAMARDLGVAIVVVRHLNKGQGGKAVYRGGGSIGFIGNARTAYTVGRDPEDRDKRILACVKMNIAAEPPSLSYSIEHADNGPFLKWHGVVDASAQEVLDGESGGDHSEVIAFLDSVVGDEPMAWREIVAAAKANGFTEKQLRSRRRKSRLVMLVGSEGRRSTRWGYLCHQQAIVAGDLHLPDVDPSSPSARHIPHIPGSGSGPETAHELPTPAVCPDDATQKVGDMGEMGAHDGQMSAPGQTAEDDEDSRLAELDARPLVCDVCGATDPEPVHRYEAPWWAIRCMAHNPMIYQAAA